MHRGRMLAGVLIGLVAGLRAVAASAWSLVDNYERRTLDLRTRAFADGAHADPAIVAVVIDQPLARRRRHRSQLGVGHATLRTAFIVDPRLVGAPHSGPERSR